MTDSEWNTCTELEPMLDFVIGRTRERKLRLFACACCRRAWHLMTDARHRRVVEAAERVADDLRFATEFAEALQAVMPLWANLPASHGEDAIARFMTSATRNLESDGGAWWVADFAARGIACTAGAEQDPSWVAARRAEEQMQCRLLCDLIGNPSRPFRFDTAWLSGPGRPAAAEASAIYDEGRFEDLPLLADILERCGCRDATILNHCRGPNTHVRGCWVVDALLGQESAVRFGLMTEADWSSCADPAPLLHFLRDKGSNRKWRLFAIACCRRIEQLIADERSRRAVVVASRSADGEAPAAEVDAARAAAYRAVEEAWRAEYEAEAEANFCLTPEYAAACCRLYTARAAWVAVCPDTRVCAAEPNSLEAHCWSPSNEWAAAAVADKVRASLGIAQGDPRWPECDAAAEAAEADEGRAHCVLLHDIFGADFGPPGKEGGWLPFGQVTTFPERRTQQWCLLPTRRKTALRREWLMRNDGLVRRLAQAIYDEDVFDRLPILADALEEAGCENAAILNHCRQPGGHVRGCWVVDLLLGKS